MAPLAIDRWLDIPPFFQSLTNFLLSQLLLLRPIVLCTFWLPILGDKSGDVFVLRFPIQIKDFSLRSEEILRMPMAFQAPSHTVRFSVVDHWHLVNLPMAAEATNAAIYMRRMVVINVVRGPMELDPLDWLSARPTRPDWLEFRVLLLNLCVASHACLSVGKVRMGRDVDKAVTITAINSKL